MEKVNKSAEEIELETTLRNILESPSRKKLVVAGPGTGKTTLFRQMLELVDGDPDRRLVLTFINNLKDDLEEDLSGLAKVFTLHSYCLRLLYLYAGLRSHLSPDFQCCPGLVSLIREDWTIIRKSEAPHFVREMRNLKEDNHIPFYLERGEYYDAVDFDDTVYRVYDRLVSGDVQLENYDLILIDEYQDFNRLEARLIDCMGKESPIMIVGDDDQALYSQLRHSSWDSIRLLHKDSEYEVFELPFCMRCPQVIVDAVDDIIVQAQELQRLKGRIEKPFKHFPPVKEVDSVKYPKIRTVQTSVQRQNANYMGRYITQAIAEIPAEEIKAAKDGGYLAALIIVANPYRDQIVSYLQSTGLHVDDRRTSKVKLDRSMGLSILKKDWESNLGWRIILHVDNPSFHKDIIVQTEDNIQSIFGLIPSDFRDKVLDEVESFEPNEEEIEEDPNGDTPNGLLPVRVTSFESAKGLSAQHVFIAGLHDNELPKNPKEIKDIEICKFVVGLTRTRKKCTLIYTRNFAGNRKIRSSFISWIDPARLEHVRVDAAFWEDS